MSIQQVIRELKKDATTYRRSGGGITLSGGEPLMQYEFASELLQACKGQGWNTAIETTGVGSREAIEKVIPYVDTVLLDIKHMDGEQHKKFTGVSNDLVIKNAPEICKISNTVIRVPVIPGFNYSVEDIKRSQSLPEPGGYTDYTSAAVSFLWRKQVWFVGQDYTLKQIKPLAPEDLEECKAVVESYGFQCIIGG